MPINVPEVAFADLAQDTSATWVVTASVRPKLRELGVRGECVEERELGAGVALLVGVGGGTLLDRLKSWRHDTSPNTRLIAVPSIWGSGAEVSPIAIRNGESGKIIQMGPEFLPDGRAYEPSLANDVPLALRQAASGDTMAHALEALTSPLASVAVRTEAAAVVRTMLDTAEVETRAWFELSARACAAQAASSVGLIHGIAHQVEGRAGLRHGHAALCQVLLLPVLEYNLTSSSKTTALFEQYGVSVALLRSYARVMFDRDRYEDIRARLVDCWPAILRDPCTRTNVALVRAGALDHFMQFASDA